MTVLVDTTIWSLALRRRAGDLGAEEQRLVAEWARLVRTDRAAIVGPIRQELLSGIRDGDQFDRVRGHLAGFDCLEIRLEDYDEAARLYNLLRSRGITGGGVDLLIAALALRHGVPVFTTDRDFHRMADAIGLRVHQAPRPGTRQR